MSSTTQKTKKPQNEKQCREMFDKLDVNHDGTISQEDLYNALTKMGCGKKSAKISAKAIMLADDQNGDGVITFEEFKNQILKEECP